LKAGRRAGVENCETVSLGLAWWVPATGSPCRLAAMGTSAGTFDPIEGDGYLWLFPDRTNVPQLLPYHPANGMQKERELIWKMGKSGREISGPPLGVLLPMDPRTRSKTTITLTGRGLRGGCQVAIANCIGTNCGLLGKVCYQIAPVPPGEYTVSIETGAGILSAPAVVTADGGSVEIAYPPAP